MTDRRCYDCRRLLKEREGWIVPFDYPSIAMLDTVPLCDRCLLARLGRGVGDNVPDLSRRMRAPRSPRAR